MTILENKAEVYIKTEVVEFLSVQISAILLHLQPVNVLSRSPHSSITPLKAGMASRRREADQSSSELEFTM